MLHLNWVIKLGVKLIISRLPVPYVFWKAIGAFRHGRMDSIEYPLKIFNLHTTRAYPERFPSKLTLLELGPGDSVASAIIASAYDASHIYLVDVGDFASKNVNFYKNIALDLRNRGLSVSDISSAKTVEDILKICNASYLTNGITDMKQIKSDSVDFIWSHSVLEHVRKSELRIMLQELKRILKPGSFSSHNIDYQDHLDKSLNNLRFPEQIWESSLFVNSGFYTNRIPAVIMHDLFKLAGFKILKEEYGKWPSLPIKRKLLNTAYKKYDDEVLINRTSHVLLKA